MSILCETHFSATSFIWLSPQPAVNKIDKFSTDVNRSIHNLFVANLAVICIKIWTTINNIDNEDRLSIPLTCYVACSSAIIFMAIHSSLVGSFCFPIVKTVATRSLCVDQAVRGMRHAFCFTECPSIQWIAVVSRWTS